MLVLILLAFIDLCSSQVYLPLNSFQGDSVINNLPLTGIQNIFISASSESADLLSNIVLQSGNDFRTLSDIRDNSIDKDGYLIPFTAHGKATITSTLTAEKMNTLTGLIYWTTADQAPDQHFLVADGLKMNGVMTPKGVNTTIVVFNTDYNDMRFPKNFVKISKWKQDPMGKVEIFYSIPMPAYVEINKIFRNPAGNESTFFENVEPFGLKMEIFHIITTSSLSLSVEKSEDFDLNGSTTTSTTTTGFYMKAMADDDSTVTIHTMKDPGHGGTSGAIAKLLIPATANGQVNFDVVDGQMKTGTVFNPTNFYTSWSTDTVGEKMVITSKDAKFGTFFIQYYTIEDGAVTDLPGSTTPNNIETTTKATNILGCFTSFLSVFLVFAYFGL